MKTHDHLTKWTRLVLAATMAFGVGLAINASPNPVAQAALGGLTDFEIDSNTIGGAGFDWLGEFAAGNVSVSNDANFTGAAVVQSDVGSASTAPSWLANCPKSNVDSVFKNSTSIADPDWTGDDETQSVTPKNDICQSYFAYDVIQSGPSAGQIVAYIAFTRRVFNGDGSYYFVLSKGPDPDVRVDGDIVIEVGYDGQGNPQTFRTAVWEGAGTPTLSGYTDANAANVEASPVQYFAEVAVNLTALGLAPNVYELPDPESCLAFGAGRVISRTGNSDSATLKDDGEPSELDFNVCGRLIIEKQLTESVPSDSTFIVDVTAPGDVSLPYPQPALVVPANTPALTTAGTEVDGSADPSPAATPTGNPVAYEVIPPRLASDGGYNVYENLAAQGLDSAWNLESITCVNDQGTPDTADDVTTEIDSAADEFFILTEQTVTCTIVNSPAPAIINVDKDAAGNAGSWPVDLTGAATDQVTVTDDGTIDFTSGGSFATFGELAAGSYTLTEGAESGGGAFRPSGWSCTVVGGGTTAAAGASIGVNADPGDVINCTITNTPVPPPSVSVVKTASPTSFPETSGTVTYTVVVDNTGTEPFTITNLDDLVGLNAGAGTSFDLDAAVATDGAGIAGSSIVSNDCAALIGDVVAPGSSSDPCQFQVSYTGRNAADVIDDTVTATVVDGFARQQTAQDDATVTVVDVLPQVVVDKQNVAVGGTVDLVFPGGAATYTIDITNPVTAIEPITIVSVTDTMSSDNAGFPATEIDLATVDGTRVIASTCSDYVGTVLAIGQTVSCTVTIDSTSIANLVPGDTLTNVIDVTAADDDGNQVQDDDAANRDILAVAPQLTVFKTDNGATIAEPGANVTYDLTITNQSSNEDVEIQVITDTVEFLPAGGTSPGDLQPRGTVVIDGGGVTANLTDGVVFVSTTCGDLIGTVLAAAGGVGMCSIVLTLPGDAGDSYEDVVEVNGIGVITNEPVDASNEAQTPVVDTLPAITIVKDVAPTSLPETGGSATFTLTITNGSVSSDPLTLTDLTDSVFGDLFGVTTGVDVTNCAPLEGTTLAPGASTVCTITATLAGNAGTMHDNTASVTGEDDEGNPVSDDDDATVTFTDVLPAITVDKTADPTSVPEIGGQVTFTVVVENDSAEAVTTTSLVDDIYGDLVGLAGSTCVVGVALDPSDGAPGIGSDTYTCTFVQNVAQLDTETSHTNTVTAFAVDDEGNPATDEDDATVTFELVPPTVLIVKTDDDATVLEPGGDVLYTLDITNTSDEAVTITTLTDTITYTDPAEVIGPLDLLGGDVGPVSGFTCDDDLVLDPGETITCTFTVALAGTAQIVTDVANVVVTDNDGQTGSDDDDESTPINDVPPTIDIVKTAAPVEINVGDTVTYTFVITNGSTIEDLTLLSLVDDKFGDIFDECGLSGVVLTPNDGIAGGTDEFTCQIDRVLVEAPGSTHVNVATVSGADDEILDNLALPVEDQDPELVPVEASDDASVLTLAPEVSVVKTLDGAATLDPSTGMWTIAYDITVSNVGAGNGIIDLDDELLFGGGVEIQTVGVATDDGATPNADFDGGSGVNGGNTFIVDGALIAGGSVETPATQTYTVTVTATIPTPVAGAGACDPEGVENGGFLNTVTLSTNGEPGPRSFACDPFSTLTLVKNLVSDDGGEASLADFVLTATADQMVYVEGTGSVTAAVPAGTYGLAETE